jgi:hypothetical protein
VFCFVAVRPQALDGRSLQLWRWMQMSQHQETSRRVVVPLTKGNKFFLKEQSEKILKWNNFDRMVRHSQESSYTSCEVEWEESSRNFTNEQLACGRKMTKIQNLPTPKKSGKPLDFDRHKYLKLLIEMHYS